MAGVKEPSQPSYLDRALTLLSKKKKKKKKGQGELYLYVPQAQQDSALCSLPPKTICNSDYGLYVGCPPLLSSPSLKSHALSSPSFPSCSFRPDPSPGVPSPSKPEPGQTSHRRSLSILPPQRAMASSPSTQTASWPPVSIEYSTLQVLPAFSFQPCKSPLLGSRSSSLPCPISIQRTNVHLFLLAFAALVAPTRPGLPLLISMCISKGSASPSMPEGTNFCLAIPVYTSTFYS